MRRFWVRSSLIEKRAKTMLHTNLLDDYGLSESQKTEKGYFKCFLRMKLGLFEWLFERVRTSIEKKETNFRKPISSLDGYALTVKRFCSTELMFINIVLQINDNASILSNRRLVRKSGKNVWCFKKFTQSIGA